MVSVDCAWHPWGSWGPCNSTCGGGVRNRNRTRTVDVHALYGGANCSGSSSETDQCSPQACPGENVFYLEERKAEIGNIF